MDPHNFNAMQYATPDQARWADVMDEPPKTPLSLFDGLASSPVRSANMQHQGYTMAHMQGQNPGFQMVNTSPNRMHMNQGYQQTSPNQMANMSPSRMHMPMESMNQGYLQTLPEQVPMVLMPMQTQNNYGGVHYNRQEQLIQLDGVQTQSLNAMNMMTEQQLIAQLHGNLERAKSGDVGEEQEELEDQQPITRRLSMPVRADSTTFAKSRIARYMPQATLPLQNQSNYSRRQTMPLVSMKSTIHENEQSTVGLGLPITPPTAHMNMNYRSYSTMQTNPVPVSQFCVPQTPTPQAYLHPALQQRRISFGMNQEGMSLTSQY